MPKITTHKVNWIDPETGNAHERVLNVYATSSGYFQIDIPAEAEGAARTAHDLYAEELKNQTHMMKWRRADVTRKKLEWREPKENPSRKFRIVARTLSQAKEGIKAVMEIANQMPEQRRLVIGFGFRASYAFAKHRETGEPQAFIPKYKDEGYGAYDACRLGDLSKTGFSRIKSEAFGVSMAAQVMWEFCRPTPQGKSYRYEIAEDDDLEYWGIKLNSFEKMGFDVSDRGQGRYFKGRDHMVIPYTEEHSQMFHDAILSLAVTAERVNEIMKSPESLLEHTGPLLLTGGENA